MLGGSEWLRGDGSQVLGLPSSTKLRRVGVSHALKSGGSPAPCASSTPSHQPRCSLHLRMSHFGDSLNISDIFGIIFVMLFCDQ